MIVLGFLLLDSNSNAPYYADKDNIVAMKCLQENGSKIAKCEWEEPKQLEGVLKHYIVRVSNGYETKIIDNKIVLKEMDGKPFTVFAYNNMSVTAVMATKEGDIAKEIGKVQFYITNGDHFQYVLDDIARAIAAKLGKGEDKHRNVSEQFGDIFQHWSFPLLGVTLIISKHARNVTGRVCFKSRLNDPCEDARANNDPCRVVILKDESEKKDIFDFPNENEHGPGMNIQLWFYYSWRPKCPTLSEVFEIKFDKTLNGTWLDTRTESSSE
ncbi:hypothetical protein Ciccas_004562 [Cichlidogyrus casuarinus]|uniref:Uncharacterized protein n=1 Tax=Cichlidogyrus casuarinus TaxID=1844966 RepID=A0ABD2QBM3_9PLAT